MSEKLEKLGRLHEFLSKDGLAEQSAMVSALLLSTVPLNEFLEHPMSSLFSGVIGGIFYSIGAGFVSDMLPKELKFIVPTSITLSTLYLMYKGINVKKQVVAQIKDTVGSKNKKNDEDDDDEDEENTSN